MIRFSLGLLLGISLSLADGGESKIKKTTSLVSYVFCDKKDAYDVMISANYDLVSLEQGKEVVYLKKNFRNGSNTKMDGPKLRSQAEPERSLAAAPAVASPFLFLFPVMTRG